MHSVESPVFRCGVCGKHFSKFKNYRAHERRHTVPSAHTCETCGHVFLDAITLQHHQQSHFAKEVNECDVCHRLFTRKTTLDSHMRLHTNDKRFQCRICGKCNGTKNDLICHMRTHTGEKPYGCDRCPEPTYFSTRSSLMRHMRTHSGYQPHSCKYCNRTFYRKDQYRRHMYKHLEYHCLSCGNIYGTYSKYSTHLITCASSLSLVPQQMPTGIDPKSETKVSNSQVVLADDNISHGTNGLLSMQLKDSNVVMSENQLDSDYEEYAASLTNDSDKPDISTPKEAAPVLCMNSDVQRSAIVHVLVEL